MRLMGGFGGLLAAVTALAALAAGLALGIGGCVPAAAGATVSGPTSTTATSGPAASSGAEATTVMPAIRPARPANAALPSYGNPNGHVPIPPAGRAVSTSHPNHVIGTGTPASCTSAAVVGAVAAGGVIVFRCGPRPVTITMRATAKVVNTSHLVVLDGGGKVTLNGAGKHQILYMDTCDPKQKWTTSDCYDQEWPHLIVQNLKFENGYSSVRQTKNNLGGGGAILAEGGQFKAVNSAFIDNRCYHVGPDLGGAAVRALAEWDNKPVYITRDTFKGGRCSNGSALSSIGVSWQVYDSVMTGNKAIGHGANPAAKGSPGGGSGGAIYTDGDSYSVLVAGTVITGNSAREGGGAIFFVSDDNTGTLTIEYSTLARNPSAGFWTRPYPGIYFHSSGQPKIIHSSIK
jgi:predicted outer membrane repeat protein